MGSLRRRGYCYEFSFACKQEAEAWRLRFRLAKVTEGDDQRAQQVVEELLCG
jgi:hypothetical protein